MRYRCPSTLPKPAIHFKYLVRRGLPSPAAYSWQKWLGKAAGVPIIIGGLVLGNIADMAYGNKLSRVSKEAEHIIENERARLVPMKQAPVSRFYSEEEKAAMFDEATAAGLVWPSKYISRSVPPNN